MDDNRADQSLGRLMGISNNPVAAGIAGVATIAGSLYALKLGNDMDRSLAKLLNLDQAAAAGVQSAQKESMERESAALETSLTNNTTKVQSQIASSAAARGIGADAVKASQEQYGSGMSGAYAAAHKALALSKVNASSAVDLAMSNYYTNMARTRLTQHIQSQATQAGIIGSIAGIAGAVTKNALANRAPAAANTTTLSNDATYSQPTLQDIALQDQVSSVANSLPTARTYPGQQDGGFR